MKSLWIYILIIIMAVYLLEGCSRRSDDHPFDPNSNSGIVPVILDLEPGENCAHLSWTVKTITDYTGFRLYKSVSNSNNFQLLDQLAPGTRNLTDTSVEQGTWYYYRITLMGYGIESKPSNQVKILLGPADIYVMSKYGYSIHRYSYDLLHQKNLYNLSGPPFSWEWDLANNYIWLVFGQFRLITRLDLNQGKENYFYNKNLDRPISVKLDSQQDKVYVLDRDAKKILIFSSLTLQDSILLDKDNYFSLELTPQPNLWVLGETDCQVFNTDGSPVTNINFGSGFNAWDILFRDNLIYILSSNEGQNQSRIDIYNQSGTLLNTIQTDGFYYIIRKLKNQSYYWMGEYLGSNNFRCVKLSGDGQRLLELDLVKGLYDIQINPYNETVVVAYYNGGQDDLVALFDRSGNIISQTTSIYDPVKIFLR